MILSIEYVETGEFEEKCAHVGVGKSHGYARVLPGGVNGGYHTSAETFMFNLHSFGQLGRRMSAGHRLRRGAGLLFFRNPAGWIASGGKIFPRPGRRMVRVNEVVE